MTGRRIWSVALAAVTMVGSVFVQSRAREALDAQLVVTPDRIDYPENAKPSVPKTYTILLANTGGTDLTFTSIVDIEDSSKGACAGPTGWMTVSGAPVVIPVGGTDSMTVTLNAGGVITCSPTVLFGHLDILAGEPVAQYVIPIQFTVADTIVVPVWDTVSTGCINLSVGTNGNMGQNGIGYVNLDFAGSPAECDTGLNSRGNAAIYLRDASPIIIRKPSPGVYRGSWSLYDDGYASPHGFKPMIGYAPHGAFSAATYEGFNSGTFLTVDSMIKCEMTWFAPKNADSCNFIIQRLRMFPATIGSPVTNLQIGLYYDFDVPSDSNGNANIGGTDQARRMAWIRGFNSADGQFDCADNSRRFAGANLITWFTKNRGCFDSLYSAKIVATDQLLNPTGGLIPESLSFTMHVAGYMSETRVTDQAVLLTLKDGQNGYTLPANDTLFVYSAICAVRNAATTVAGLDSLKRTADKAKLWTLYNLGICACSVCCWWKTGNVNQTGAVDLSDLSALVNYLTGGGYVLPCYDAANINAIGIVDLADLSWLICYLTGGGCALPDCLVTPYPATGCFQN